MQVTAPSGRVYDVRRRWLPWRQRIPIDTELFITVLAAVELVLRVVLAPLAVLLRVVRVVPWVIEVHDLGARRERAVVTRERVRGWGPSQARIRALGRELESRDVDPQSPAFPVVVTLSSASMGDDAADDTRVIGLEDRTAPPTLATLITAIRDRGLLLAFSGDRTTWVLRESTRKKRPGRPLAVFDLDGDSRTVDVHPVGDTSYRVAREGSFHLEHLSTQSVERTLELIARDPSGKRSLRDGPQA